MIEWRCRNMRKGVDNDKKKFLRKKTGEETQYPSYLRDDAAKIAILQPISYNRRFITEGMENCQPLLKWLINFKHSDAVEIIQIFPHLIAYDGDVIRKTFENLNPGYDANVSLDLTLRRGLIMIESGWDSVTDVLIKGGLRLIKLLSNQGIKKCIEEACSADETLASPLIKWIPQNQHFTARDAVEEFVMWYTGSQYRLICVGTPEESGEYFTVLDKIIIPCGSSGLTALDTLLKSFQPLNIKVPPILQKLFDLIAITTWRILKNSSRIMVRRVSARLDEFQRSHTALT
ncbi:uncharacterized protein LOC129755004 [Uranotaenia lowii]|uniref:uncharacterized protein LOC129755004 n=1 Tax=Uranotaenia lowii TaxID=190385 RepID=UPI002478F809|nr:uncharacterized protein LOC129755004 [Uranotaenia lowii]